MKKIKKLLAVLLAASLSVMPAFSSFANGMSESGVTSQIEPRTNLVITDDFEDGEITITCTYVVSDGNKILEIRSAFVSYTYPNVTWTGPVRTNIVNNGAYATLTCDYKWTNSAGEHNQTAYFRINP